MSSTQIIDLYEKEASGNVVIHTTSSMHSIAITKVILYFSIPDWNGTQYKQREWIPYEDICLFTNRKILYTKLGVPPCELECTVRRLTKSHPRIRIYNQHALLTLLMIDCPALRLWKSVKIEETLKEHRGTYVWYTGSVVTQLEDNVTHISQSHPLYLHIETEIPSKRPLPVASWKHCASKYQMDQSECCSWDVQCITRIHVSYRDASMIFEHRDERTLLQSFRNWFVKTKYEILAVWDYETGLDYINDRCEELDMTPVVKPKPGVPPIQHNGRIRYTAPGGFVYFSVLHMMMLKNKLPPNTTPIAIARKLKETNMALALRSYASLSGSISWLAAHCEMNICTHRNAFDSYWLHWLTLLLKENPQMLHRTYPQEYLDDSSSGGACYDVDTNVVRKHIWKIDITSCYPSIIRQYKLCYRTISGVRKNESDREFVLCVTRLDAQKRRVYVTNETSVIPALIENGILKREDLKDRMQKTKDETLDHQQQAIKLHNNRFYGLLHSKTIFANTLFARLIATIGQNLIGELREIAKTLGASTVAGDTDCVMMACSSEVAHQVYNEFNTRYQYIKVGKPEAFDRIYFVSKKCYVGMHSGTLVEKGLPGMTVNHPAAIHEIVRYVYNRVLLESVDVDDIRKCVGEKIASAHHDDWASQIRPQILKFLQIPKSVDVHKRDALLIVESILLAVVGVPDHDKLQ